MAFVLPVLLFVLFGIMEFGYYIFAYSSVSQAARNAAETASQLPPHQGWLDYAGAGTAPGGVAYRADKCVDAIYRAVESDATLFDGGVNQGRDIINYVQISYPNGGDTRNLNDRGPIEITITYPVRGITPLYQLVGLEGNLSLKVTQRRSIESLGVDPSRPQGVACAKNIADWNELNAN
jgi:hypothetical protein